MSASNEQRRGVRRQSSTSVLSGDRGIAMITTMFVLMLMSALLVGFTAIVMSDQRFRFIDRDRGQSFYAASGGIEKLTADLGNLFFANVAPTAAQIAPITTNQPAITGVSYVATAAPAALPASALSTYYCGPAPKVNRIVGSNGYSVMFCTDATGNPVATSVNPIKSGPYEGLIAAQTPFQIDVTAHTASGGDTHLIRTMEAVAIPVFQFGIYSDVDLAFNAGDNFSFGGRVHTNGNLYLAEAANATLTLSDKVTAVKEVVRQRLSNGVSIDTSGHTGTISMATSPTTFRTLARTEGSVTDGPTSSQNEPTWHTISLSNYNSWIRNSRTGAKPLNLPLVTVGGSNPDLVRRPATPNENTTNFVLFGERLFSKASLRILLSDTAADITNLPTVTATAPVSLDGDWFTTPPNNGTAYGPVNSTHPPIARTAGPFTTTVNSATSTTAIIKVASVAPFRPLMVLDGQVVTCTVKDAANNRFTGCTVGVAVLANKNLTSGPGISVVSTAAVAAGTGKTITVGAGNTAPFNPLPFWIGDTLISCTGWDATLAFTGCSGLPAAPANGATLTSHALSSANTGLIGGFIKMELQDTNGVWRDVTMEILNQGIGAPNVDGVICADPTPNAIVRLQRLRDNGGAGGGGCNYNTDATGAKNANNWWPNTIFDTREALQRDINPATTNVILGGVMHYVSLDAGNLVKWFRGTGAYVGSSGPTAITENGGFTVYFSDRRNNRTAANLETGERGWEDFVNPASATGAPNSVLDTGEDVNGSNALETYGGTPNYNGISGSLPPGAAFPLIAGASPTTALTPGQAEVNRAILFRRALKLVNGALIGGPNGVTGLTVVSENPVYVRGDWNANSAGGAYNDPHAATAVMSDAITLLSNNWNDINSFKSPYDHTGRVRSANTYYRMGVIAGKGAIFPQPAGTGGTFGTDGGAHAFMRFLEGNGAAPDAVHYRGSLATFFYNRQAVGVFKCCTTVYGLPANRDYVFETEFLTPALLPPNTPVFRDMNAVGFSQELRPGK